MMNSLAGRKILVTGATGFVGGWLTKQLRAEGAYVVALVRDFDPQSEFIRTGEYKHCSIISGCLEDYSALERAINEHETSAVFHLAAQAIVGAAQRSPLATMESNIRGTYNLLEACRVHSSLVQAVVVASSDKAYGRSQILPYVEEMPLAGSAPYEVSKSCADLIAQSYYASYNVPVGIARCGNIYGGGDLNWSRIIPGTIKCLLDRQNPIIRSDGTFVRDYIYVKDVVAAYIAIADGLLSGKCTGEAFNFSPEKPYSVLDVVAAIQKMMGLERLKPVVENSANGEIHSQWLDSTKAKTTLGWAPAYTLEQGLAETIEWYTSFLHGHMKQSASVAEASIS